MDADRYDHPYRFQAVYNFEEPTAYSLSWSLTGLYDDVLFPSSRFVEMGFATGQSEEVTLADIEDEDVTLTDRTDTYSTASIDDEVELTTTLSPGDFDAMYVDVLYTENERGDATSSAAGPIDDGGSGGPLSWLFSLPGMILGGVGGYFALSKIGWIGDSR